MANDEKQFLDMMMLIFIIAVAVVIFCLGEYVIRHYGSSGSCAILQLGQKTCQLQT